MMTIEHQITPATTKLSAFEQECSSGARVLNRTAEQGRLLEKALASMMQLGGSLRQLLLSAEPNILQVACTIQSCSTNHELLLAPASDESVNIVDLLVELDCLDATVKYLKRVRNEGEKQRFAKLYDLGRVKLIEESEKLIRKYAHPLPPDDLLSLCRTDTQTPIATDTIEVSDLGAFRLIFDWFTTFGFQQGLMDAYSKKKGTMILNSLQLLLEHLRNTSVPRPSINVINAGRYSPIRRFLSSPDALRDKFQTTLGGLGRRLTRSPVIGGTASLSRSSQFLSPNGYEDQRFLSVGHLTIPNSLNDNIETNHYRFLLEALLALLYRELDLLFYAFCDEFRSSVFTKLIDIPFVYMQHEAQKLCETVRQLPNKINTGKSYLHGILSILNWFLRSKTKFTKLYHESKSSHDYPFTSTLALIFEQSVMECLRLVLDDVQKDSSAPAPGGAVHPMTSDLMSFIRDLTDYEHVITSISSIDPNGKLRRRSAGSKLHDLGRFDLSAYFANLIRSLVTNLREKADEYIRSDDQSIGRVFLLNNTKYLLDHLEYSPLLIVIKRTEPNLRIELTHQLQHYIKQYTECCRPLITAMQSISKYDQAAGASSKRLSERDRQQIKQSLLTVNSLIDIFRERNGQHSIDDPQLRDQLRNEIKETILQRFTNCYSRFSQTKFTRNAERYLRYSPQMLQSIIEHLFEQQCPP